MFRRWFVRFYLVLPWLFSLHICFVNFIPCEKYQPPFIRKMGQVLMKGGFSTSILSPSSSRYLQNWACQRILSKKVRNSTLCAALIENRPYLIQNWSKKSGNFRKPSSNIVEKLCRLKFSGIRSSLDGFLRWNWKALFTVSTGERFHAHHFTKTFITSTIFESPQISKNQNFRETWGYHYEFFQIF